LCRDRKKGFEEAEWKEGPTACMPRRRRTNCKI